MNVSGKKYTSKKFLIAFAISALAVFFLIGLGSYLIDPFFQFRVNPNARYILNPRFVNGGLARNYDYNTVLLGSSMVQNCNVSLLRAEYEGMRPVKLSTGGMNLPEMELLYSLTQKEKVENYIINIDMPFFNQSGMVSRYPAYLYEDGILNKLKYLYGYETWMQYIPADIGLSIYFGVKDNIPEIYRLKTSIDNIGNDSYGVEYTAESVKNLYLSGQAVSPQYLDYIEIRMNGNLERFLSNLELDKHKDIKYTFMFPSYSALYWYHARQHDYYDHFLNFVRHFTKAVEKYDNVRIAFFLDREEITNLSYYGDITHFGPALSDSIMKNLFNPEYEMDTSNLDLRMHRVDSLVDSFTDRNKDWLPK